MSAHRKRSAFKHRSDDNIISDLLVHALKSPLGRAAMISVAAGFVGGLLATRVRKPQKYVLVKIERIPASKPKPQSSTRETLRLEQTSRRASNDDDIIATPNGCALPWDYMP